MRFCKEPTAASGRAGPVNELLVLPPFSRTGGQKVIQEEFQESCQCVSAYYSTILRVLCNIISEYKYFLSVGTI